MQRTYVKKNITVIEVDTRKEATKTAFELLKGTVDKNSILFLSGGSSPVELYETIAKDRFRQVRPGAAATIDERWGPPGHEASNEAMLCRIGLYDYFQNQGAEIITILQGILNRRETALRYDTVLQGLLERFRHSVAIMGVGEDGHTAGLAPNRADWKNPAFSDENKHRLVVDFKNPRTVGSTWRNAERITATPRLLSEIKNFVVLLVGEKKRKVLRKLLNEDLRTEKFPATIYKSLKGKVRLITDQHL